MWKKLLFRAMKALAAWALMKAWNYIDSDDNGELSLAEVEAFGRETYNLGRRIRNKAY